MNMNILLTANEYKYVMSDPCLDIGEESIKEDREAKKVLKKVGEMIHWYILISMSNVLQPKHENMTITYDIDFSL